MKFFKKAILILIFLFPFSSSFATVVTHFQTGTFEDDHQEDDGARDGILAGIEFNRDGTKMFTSFGFDPLSPDGDYHMINEYNLSTPYDISTKTYAGTTERCELGNGTNGVDTGGGAIVYDLEFSSDGMKIFITSRQATNGADKDKVYRFDLTSAYDISTCAYAQETTNLDSDTYNNEFDYTKETRKNRVQGVEINNDGTKLFLAWMDVAGSNSLLLEYNLTTPYDLTTMTLVTNAGINVGTGGTGEVNNPASMRFSANGKRIFIVSHSNPGVTQISLTNAYDTSSFTIDGKQRIDSLTTTNTESRGIAFSGNGLKMYIGSDRDQNALDQVMEYDLVCPFNIITGSCPSITENSDRVGMAEAQIELARRTIESATNSTLNRLKWIRRNEDKQNLTNLNIDLNFSNKILNSLTKAVRASTAKKNTKEKEQDVFYWSEGSIAVGRMGNTSISSSKEIDTRSLTFGADKFTDNNGIVGLAFRYGRDNTDVGNSESTLDGDTYNLTFYNTRPSKVDTKYIDTIFGIGKIKTDILTVMDGKHLTANRRGKQMYGTLKIKDEIKKNKLTIIPSSQIDFGHTILNAYDEVGTGAISVKKQHVKSRNLRATVAASHDLENERYSIKRHGKLEYQANLKRSSEFKYTYVDERSKSFSEKLAPGSFHNINGEIGIDIVFPENYSIFIIYERNQALDYGHTDNIHIALGYLPNKDTEYAFKIEGSENLISKFEIKKDINGFDLSFNLNDDLTSLGDSREANIELNKVF